MPAPQYSKRKDFHDTLSSGQVKAIENIDGGELVVTLISGKQVWCRWVDNGSSDEPEANEAGSFRLTKNSELRETGKIGTLKIKATSNNQKITITWWS